MVEFPTAVTGAQETTVINDTSLYVVIENGVFKKITGAAFKTAIGTPGGGTGTTTDSRLPTITLADAGKILAVNPAGNAFIAIDSNGALSTIPAITVADAGKTLVANAAGDAFEVKDTYDAIPELPALSVNDKGKIQVLNDAGDAFTLKDADDVVTQWHSGVPYQNSSWSLGVSVAGLEYNTTGTNYFTNSLGTFQFLRDRNTFSEIRTPYKNDRLFNNKNDGVFNPTITALGKTYIDLLKDQVAHAKSVGLACTLDDHSYARFGSDKWGDGNYTIANQVTMSTAIAEEFKGDPGVYSIEIMNEPNQIPAGFEADTTGNGGGATPYKTYLTSNYQVLYYNRLNGITNLASETGFANTSPITLNGTGTTTGSSPFSGAGSASLSFNGSGWATFPLVNDGGATDNTPDAVGFSLEYKPGTTTNVEVVFSAGHRLYFQGNDGNLVFEHYTDVAGTPVAATVETGPGVISRTGFNTIHCEYDTKNIRLYVNGYIAGQSGYAALARDKGNMEYFPGASMRIGGQDDQAGGNALACTGEIADFCIYRLSKASEFESLTKKSELCLKQEYLFQKKVAGGRTITSSQQVELFAKAVADAIHKVDPERLVTIPLNNFNSLPLLLNSHPGGVFAGFADWVRYAGHFYPDQDNSGQFVGGDTWLETARAKWAANGFKRAGYDDELQSYCAQILLTFWEWAGYGAARTVIGEFGMPNQPGIDAAVLAKTEALLLKVLEVARACRHDFTYWSIGEAAGTYTLEAYNNEGNAEMNTVYPLGDILEQHDPLYNTGTDVTRPFLNLNIGGITGISNGGVYDLYLDLPQSMWVKEVYLRTDQGTADVTFVSGGTDIDTLAGQAVNSTGQWHQQFMYFGKGKTIQLRTSNVSTATQIQLVLKVYNI